MNAGANLIRAMPFTRVNLQYNNSDIYNAVGSTINGDCECTFTINPDGTIVSNNSMMQTVTEFSHPTHWSPGQPYIHGNGVQVRLNVTGLFPGSPSAFQAFSFNGVNISAVGLTPYYRLDQPRVIRAFSKMLVPGPGGFGQSVTAGFQVQIIDAFGLDIGMNRNGQMIMQSVAP